MDEKVPIVKAKEIMGENFIGPEELLSIREMKVHIPCYTPQIPYDAKILDMSKNEYMLIYGAESFADGRKITIRNMQTIFGKNPNVMEPCFYNQDWYDKEKFIDKPMEEGWYLIRKSIFDESRALDPSVLMHNYSFPSAIKCCYSFFVTWIVVDEKLWLNEFVWCNDKDHNGDQIYVGKYKDIDDMNKNGFNIHRHLSIRSCYGCV